ncbi:MAG: hypothetical protein GY808_09210, partial [Gammaproteobacteria bacterium]|nr:hypothetical protein [Gammaproteobacteria bacterium]
YVLYTTNIGGTNDGVIKWNSSGNLLAAENGSSVKIYSPTDIINPQLSVSYPVDNHSTYDEQITTTGFVFDQSGVSLLRIETEVDTFLITSFTNNEFNQEINLIDGMNEIRYFCYDMNWNKTEMIRNIVKSVDNTAPIISNVTVNASEIQENEDLLVTAQILDGESGILSGLSKIIIHNADSTNTYQMDLYDDGTHGDLTASDNTYSVFFNISSLSLQTVDDIYYIDIIATDNSTSQNVAYENNAQNVFIYDIPVISNLSLQPMVVYDNDSINVNVTVTDSSYITRVNFNYKNSASTNYQIIQLNKEGSTDNYSKTISPQQAGTFDYFINAIDLYNKQSNSDTSSITINAYNDPPVIISTADTTALEDQLYEYSVLASDPDVGDILTYYLQTHPGFLSIDSSTGVIIGTPTNSDVGTHSVAILVRDSERLTDMQNYQINVLNTNDPPVITSQPNTTTLEDQLYEYQITATDPDIGDSLIYSLVMSPAWLGLDSISGLVNGTPTNDDIGETTVMVTVDDGNFSKTTIDQTYNLTVINVNDSPVLNDTIPDQSYTEDSGPHTVVTDLNNVFSDPDPGDALSFAANSNRFNIQVSVQGNTLSVNSTLNYYGNAIIIVTGTDLYGLSVSDTFAVEVRPINDEPEITGIPDISFPEDSSYAIDLDNYVTDVDHSIASLNWISTVLTAQPFIAGKFAKSKTGHGFAINPLEVVTGDLQITIDPSTHIATFTSTGDTSGVFEVLFTVADDSSDSDMDTINVTIHTVNDTPFVANPISDKSYDEDTGPHIVVTDLYNVFSDSDPGDVLTFTASSDNSDIQVSVQGNTLNVNLTPNYFGNGNITVTATDQDTASAVDIFAIEIRPINDAPEITGIPDISFPEDSSYAIDLDNYVIDVDDLVASLDWISNVLTA